MGTLRLVYARGRSVGGLLIRAASWWDQWSHVGIVDGDTVLEARAFHGIVATPRAAFLSRYTAHEFVDVPVTDPAKGLAWAREQIGQGYDYGAIARFITGAFGIRQSERRMHCVEFAEGAVLAAGRIRFRRPAHALTVAQSFMVI